MTTRNSTGLGAALLLALLGLVPVHAQLHTATRLGNPGSRFASPLRKPEDLRAMLRAPDLQGDIAAILLQSDWPGNLSDLHRAAAEAEITELQIPPGTRLPAMSSRKNGRPVLLRDVLWAGAEPIDAYEFTFVSKGRRYRVVTPKACSNFWVEDQGPYLPPARPGLHLAKTAPASATLCEPILMELAVRNSGNTPLTQVQVTDALPAGLATADQQPTLRFDAGTLQPGEGREFTFRVMATAPGGHENRATATAAEGVSAEARARTVVQAPALAIRCNAPAEVPAGRPVRVCVTVQNAGDAPDEQVTVALPIPDGATCEGVTTGGKAVDGRVVWQIGPLAPAASREVCGVFTLPQPGPLAFTATAQGTCAPEVKAQCGTRVAGIPGILLEVVDLDDPIEVGGEETYEITVTNQGSATDSNIRVSCALEATQQFVSGAGATAVAAQDGRVTMTPLPVLEPKAKASWRVVVKALAAGDVRFGVELLSDQIIREVRETEATRQY